MVGGNAILGICLALAIGTTPRLDFGLWVVIIDDLIGVGVVTLAETTLLNAEFVVCWVVVSIVLGEDEGEVVGCELCELECEFEL